MSALQVFNLVVNGVSKYLFVLANVLQHRIYNAIITIGSVLRSDILNKALEDKAGIKKPAPISATVISDIDKLIHLCYSKRQLTAKLHPWSVRLIALLAASGTLAHRAARDYNITVLTPVLRLLAAYRGIHKNILFRSGGTA